MIDHVGIYGSRVAEGLSAFNVGLVFNNVVIITYEVWCKKAITPLFLSYKEMSQGNVDIIILYDIKCQGYGDWYHSNDILKNISD